MRCEKDQQSEVLLRIILTLTFETYHRENHITTTDRATHSKELEFICALIHDLNIYPFRSSYFAVFLVYEEHWEESQPESSLPY